MPRRIRRTEIQIETHEVSIISFAKPPRTEFCERCCRSVHVFNETQAARMLDNVESDLQQLIAEDRIHLVSDSEFLLVCGASLGIGEKHFGDLKAEEKDEKQRKS